jgi:autophagy-related protein 2
VTIYEDAFKVPPDIGPEPDMVKDDLPSNTDFIDGAYGSDAGVRPITDEDAEDDVFDKPVREGENQEGPTGLVSTVRGETIRLFTNEGIRVIEGYFDRLPPESLDSSSR